MAGLIGFSGAANAADVYAKVGGLKDEPVGALPPVWVGLYVGGSVGYGWGDAFDIVTEVSDPATPGTDSIRVDSDNLDGVAYGAYLGYNFQYGNFVFGPEIGITGADMGAAPFEEEFSGRSINHDLNWYATAVGRVGYAYKDILLYGFGGVAWSRVQTDFSDAFNRDDARDATVFVGWTAGVGVEYALSDRFRLRLEYAHVDLGSEKNFNDRIPEVDFELIRTNETDIEFDVVKIGASYRFGGRD